jgi:hypothetical protein
MVCSLTGFGECYAFRMALAQSMQKTSNALVNASSRGFQQRLVYQSEINKHVIGTLLLLQYDSQTHSLQCMCLFNFSLSQSSFAHINENYTLLERLTY